MKEGVNPDMKVMVQKLLPTPSPHIASARRRVGKRKAIQLLYRSALHVAFFTLASGSALAGPVKIVANPHLKADTITTEELQSLFLEQTRSLRDGSHVEPVQERTGVTRDLFLSEYLDRDAAEIRDYYLRLAFTGKGSVPREFNSDAEVIAYVAKTKGAIGYVSTNTSSEGVKTLVVVPASRNGDRVLLTRVEPEYPEVLRQHLVGGTVRLRLVISPSGSVEDASLLGGNPILGEAAIAAVKQWIYAPSRSRTTTEVKIPFEPKL